MSSDAVSDPLQRLRRRLKTLKSRVLIHRWELRQRHHAKGSWARLGRVLAGAEAVYALPDEAAEALEAAGTKAIDVGFELAPPLRMYWVDLAVARGLAGHRRLAVRLDHELLRARALALVPFASTSDSGPPA